ncbi:MAG: FAD:protein FMN transferase, partial [Christensenellales bacterium]
MKKAAGILLLVLLVAAFALPGSADMNKYSTVFMDTFDTVISLIGYAENQETFDARAAETHAMYLHLHKLFDTYNSYADEGITSVCDVNRQAAVEPVKVDPILFGLLTFCKSNYELVNGQTNVAMGSVLSIWHEYREAGLDDPENAKLPPMADLQAAAQHMNIDDLILDEAAQTVYFADPEMKLDVGAVAKGYATEIVSQMLLAGDMPSFIISAGGNVRMGNPPADGRTKWGVGIQDPDGAVL